MLKQRIYPLRTALGYFGFNLATNGWAYNEGSTLYAADLMGKPLGRAAIGSGVANIVRGGANTDIYKFKNGLFISLAVDYGNRTGAGNYNGSWIDVCPNLHFRF